MDGRRGRDAALCMHRILRAGVEISCFRNCVMLIILKELLAAGHETRKIASFYS